MPSSIMHDPIAIALAEDIGTGDLTSRYFVGTEERSARIFAKEPAVAAGVGTGAEVFRRVDSQLAVRVVREDGSPLAKGDTVLEIRGAVRSILTAERVALNFIQRLSGTATLTRRFVEAVAGTRARILDTRKTTPGLRALEKAAVVFALVPKVSAALWERSSERDSVSPPAHDDLKRSSVLTRPPPKRSFAPRVRSQSAALTLGTRQRDRLTWRKTDRGLL